MGRFGVGTVLVPMLVVSIIAILGIALFSVQSSWAALGALKRGDADGSGTAELQVITTVLMLIPGTWYYDVPGYNFSSTAVQQ